MLPSCSLRACRLGRSAVIGVCRFVRYTPPVGSSLFRRAHQVRVRSRFGMLSRLVRGLPRMGIVDG